MEVFTKGAVNEGLALTTAADGCKDELPLKLRTEHEKVSEIMTQGGTTSVLKAKAVMEWSGVDKKCIAIFGLICSKAEEFGALDRVKEACINL